MRFWNLAQALLTLTLLTGRGVEAQEWVRTGDELGALTDLDTRSVQRRGRDSVRFTFRVSFGGEFDTTLTFVRAAAVAACGTGAVQVIANTVFARDKVSAAFEEGAYYPIWPHDYSWTQVTPGTSDGEIVRRACSSIDRWPGWPSRPHARPEPVIDTTRWESVGFTETLFFYVDRQVRRLGADSVAYWSTTFRMEPEDVGQGRTSTRTMSRLIADCRSMSSARSDLIFYGDWAGRDHIRTSRYSDDLSWTGAVPGSVGESVMERACSLAGIPR